MKTVNNPITFSQVYYRGHPDSEKLYEHIEFFEFPSPWPFSSFPSKPPSKKKNRPGQRAIEKNTNNSADRTFVLLVNNSTLRRILSRLGKK